MSNSPDPSHMFRVVVNDSAQHAMWPERLPVPAGWSTIYGPAARETSLAFVEGHWQDMRPATEDTDGLSITDLFANQVKKNPAATALRFDGRDMTYQELDQRTNDVAHQLGVMGVEREHIVGVCFERSFEMVIALLGVLKSGAAYLPMHPDDPIQRLSFMLEQAESRVVLTHQNLIDNLGQLKVDLVKIDSSSEVGWGAYLPLGPSGPDGLAYICFTSGSTGEPKGVLIPHRGVTRLVHDADYAELSSNETFLQLCALTFDPSVFEVWGALLNGGRLVIYPPGPLSLANLAECIQNEQITTLWLTTGLFHRMVESHLDSLGCLRQLLAGGDMLSPAYVNQLRGAHPHVRFVNGYGPTENTCFTTCHEVDGAVSGTVPIGRAVAGTRTYVLDSDLQHLPDGHWGELHAAGTGLARGYLRSPGITADKFLPDPFVAGERMYKIGDIARRNAEGVIEFRGRVDDQVKVGGYRVELGEITAALLAQASVKQAVTVVRTDVSPGEKVLVAYIVPHYEDETIGTELRLALYRTLPGHMIPSAIVLLPAFPLTRNGKIDRQALPGLTYKPRDVDTEFVAPRNPTEILLAELWSDVLSVDRVGVHDDFFEIGGNSLIAADLLTRMRDQLSVAIRAAQLFFENPTVAGLAGLIDIAPALDSAQSGGLGHSNRRAQALSQEVGT